MTTDNDRRTVVVFDFDGTLTYHDSLSRFAIFTVGICKFIKSLVMALPAIILWKLGKNSNEKAKERLFYYLYSGMPSNVFLNYCENFKKHIDKDLRENVIRELRKHVANGDTVYIISASNAARIRPWARTLGVKDVIGTEAEINNDGKLTGFFATPNCYGEEKVNRLLHCEPARNSYNLIVYGNDEGDDALMLFSDIKYRVSQNFIF